VSPRRIEEAGPTTFLRRLPKSEQLGRGMRRALWAVGAMVVLYILLLGEGGWIRIQKLRVEIDALDSDIQWLESKQGELRSNLDALAQPGGMALEKVARERYGLRKPGERVVHILGKGEETLAPEAPEMAPRKDDR
jgi:cell division protein FtsB